MALRLAGEEFSVVQGLDNEGWVEKVRNLSPSIDNAYYNGSATKGWKGLYFPTMRIVESVADDRLMIQNAAGSTLRGLILSYLRFTDKLRGGGNALSIETNDDTGAYITLEGYGSGALVEHARLAPNNFELKNGKLTGALVGNSQEMQGVKHIMRKASVSGVAPSATANTYGTATDINPTSGYYGLNPLVRVALTSGGTFGAETLTVRITATFSDATTSSITKDFTATGGTDTLSAVEIADNLMKDGVAITKLSVDCKSTIASSTATGGANITGLNT